MWKKKKKINLTDARALSYKFCKDFNIPYCEIYFVDTLSGNYGQYIYLLPPHILILEKVINRIGVLVHELTHHLECQDYLKDCEDKESTHGYSFQLSKQRVVSWCRKNISQKPNWFIPLKAFAKKKDMIDFKL